MTQLLDLVRHFINQPGLLPIKHGIRSLQTLLNYSDYQQVKRLTSSLALAPLLERQPRFAYKYLSRYSAASFSRTKRLAALLNHYHFLTAAVTPAFFQELHERPVIWQAECGGDQFAISLSYPQQVGFEGELSLNFSINSTLLQVVGFSIVPGRIVGATGKQALLFSQVQGVHDAALLKYATRALHDITPATLLINAAYGLAAALRIRHAAGISSEEQLSSCRNNFFDYNAFWGQFRGERTADNLFLLAVPASEWPIKSVKANHRARTLRKRQYKQQLRAAVEAYCQEAFLKGEAGGVAGTTIPHVP